MTRMCNKCHSPEARGIGSEASPASHREETTDSEAPHVTSPSSNVRSHKRFLDMGHHGTFRKEIATARHDTNVGMKRYTYRLRYILCVPMEINDHTCTSQWSHMSTAFPATDEVRFYKLHPVWDVSPEMQSMKCKVMKSMIMIA